MKDSFNDFAFPDLPAGFENRKMIDTAKLLAAHDRMQGAVDGTGKARQEIIGQINNASRVLQGKIDALHEQAHEEEQQRTQQWQFQQQQAARIADYQRMTAVATIVSDGMQGQVSAPQTARFRKQRGAGVLS